MGTCWGKEEEEPYIDKVADLPPVEVVEEEDDAETPQALGLRTTFGYEQGFKNKFVLGKELGRGAMGVTFQASCKKDGQPMQVAVKIVKKEKLVHQDMVDNLRREILIMQILSDDPNVVDCYGAFEDAYNVYIVMELCEGGELFDRILMRGRYTERDAADLVRQMLKVVARCHLNGVVHRDLKPENFLFKTTDEHSPLIAVDFGLARRLKPGRWFSDRVGTARYLAPEVLKRRTGAMADVWSIGVITYILLSGKMPFGDENEAILFESIKKLRPDLSCSPWPTISDPAKDFVRKLLTKEPQNRPSAAQALSHPWVRVNGLASDLPIDIVCLGQMREFVKYDRIKQIAFRALASTLEDEDVVELRDQFERADSNRDGVISIEEMRELTEQQKVLPVPESTLQKSFHAIDTDKDGVIEFDEFVTATMWLHKIKYQDGPARYEARCRRAFALLDRDHNGYIDAEELRKASGVRGSLSVVREGREDDHKIYFDEFKELLNHATSIGEFSQPSFNKRQ